MKNIAIIIQHLYGGGAERSASSLSKYLSRIYRVYIFLEDDRDSYNDYGGTKIMVVPEEGKSRAHILKELKAKYRIDCAISFMEQNNILNFKSKGREAVIFSYRNTLSKVIIPKTMEYSMRWMSGYADHIVAVSEGCRYDLIKNYGFLPDSITTIYNYINKEKILEKADQPVDDSVAVFRDKSKLLLHVGRLVKQKNQERLLVQFARLITDHQDVKLLMIGSGQEEEALKDKIGELGITDKVKMIPFTGNPFPYYRYADALVLTSRAEGLPNVLLEAMFLRTPVVAVDCMSGPRELLAEDKDYERKISAYEICKNGILVENADTDDVGTTDYLCKAMECMLMDEALRERSADHAYKFMEAYSNESILNQWKSVIENTKIKELDCDEKNIPALRDKSEVIVYGAGEVGTEVMLDLLEKRNGWEFICFAVTDKSTCESPVKDIPLFELTELYDHKSTAVVVISVGEQYEEEVLENVKKHGFQYAWAR